MAGDEFKRLRLDAQSRQKLKRWLAERARIPEVDVPFLAAYRHLAEVLRGQIEVQYPGEDMHVLARYGLVRPVCGTRVTIPMSDKLGISRTVFFFTDGGADDVVLGSWAASTVPDVSLVTQVSVPAKHSNLLRDMTTSFNMALYLRDGHDNDLLRVPQVQVAVDAFVAAVAAWDAARRDTIDPIIGVIREARTLQEVAEVWPLAMDYALVLGGERRPAKVDKDAAKTAAASVAWGAP